MRSSLAYEMKRPAVEREGREMITAGAGKGPTFAPVPSASKRRLITNQETRSCPV